MVCIAGYSIKFGFKLTVCGTINKLINGTGGNVNVKRYCKPKAVLYNNFINKKLPVVMEELQKYRELSSQKYTSIRYDHVPIQ